MAEALFQTVADSEGWSERTQIIVLLRYIENQASSEAFADFLNEQRSEPLPTDHPAPTSPADDFLWSVAFALQNPGLALNADFQQYCANCYDLLTIEQAAHHWRLRDANPPTQRQKRARQLPHRSDQQPITQARYTIDGTVSIPSGSKLAAGSANLIELPDGGIVSVHPIIEFESRSGADDHRNLTYEQARAVGVTMEDYDRSTILEAD